MLQFRHIYNVLCQQLTCCVFICVFRFVYLVLSHLELELCDSEAQMPEVNTSRFGFGMLQPEGDLAIRYKPRRSR